VATRVSWIWISWPLDRQPKHQIARGRHLLREHEVVLGVLGDGLGCQLELRRHLGLHTALLLELDEEKVDVGLHLLPALLVLLLLLCHGAQHELSLDGGFGFGFQCRGDHPRTQPTESGFIGDQVATNNFVSPDLNQPPYGDFTAESMGFGSGATEVEDKWSIPPVTPCCRPAASPDDVRSRRRCRRFPNFSWKKVDMEYFFSVMR
jgi:hypothetical protein